MERLLKTTEAGVLCIRCSSISLHPISKRCVHRTVLTLGILSTFLLNCEERALLDLNLFFVLSGSRLLSGSEYISVVAVVCLSLSPFPLCRISFVMAQTYLTDVLKCRGLRADNPASTGAAGCSSQRGTI
ncbi:hypothetical protein DPX16_10730 [Anabarilius grahami]|uniref:Uncharacterized protein n=1 Tax=Anabarilius grahami TaxID=495550 RepID=A0A3N0Z776_ANAGA|nr:hypothetical protein DPX16_10730 [Anabarilius grahami]